MSITEKTIKLLWAASGGRCAFPECWERLCYSEAGDHAPYTLGEMAHICGDKPGANRYDASQTSAERDGYKNLILLCPTHHAMIDRKENEAVYAVEKLLAMKAAHEAKVLAILDRAQTVDKVEIARDIFSLLQESRQSWLRYGPLSDIARSQPHNEAVHAVWVSERLSIIVPNNRKIAHLLTKHKAVFEATEQEAIASFLIHVRSYEQWVEDKIPYSAVVRFPVAFEELIGRIADASAQ